MSRRMVFLPIVAVFFLHAACEGREDQSTHVESLAIGDSKTVHLELVPPAPSVTLLGEITTPAMKGPTRIAVAPDGDMVVTDPRARLVHVLHPDGSQRFLLEHLRSPLGCAVDGQGRIYIGDRATGAVHVFSRGGEPVRLLGRGNREFLEPNELAIDRKNGTVYVVDSKADRVIAYDTDGKRLFRFGGTGSLDGEFRFPTGILFDAREQQLYVVDHTNARIQAFDRWGRWVGSFGSYGGGRAEFTRPQGIALDHEGRLYVTDAFQGQVQIVDTAGRYVGALGDFGRGYGRARISMDAALDPWNRLLIASPLPPKVLVFGIDRFSKPDPGRVVKQEKEGVR